MFRLEGEVKVFRTMHSLFYKIHRDDRAALPVAAKKLCICNNNKMCANYDTVRRMLVTSGALYPTFLWYSFI